MINGKFTKSVLLLIAVFFSISTVGQEIRFKGGKNYKKVKLTPYDNSSYDIYRISGIFKNAKKVIYKDEKSGYEINVPLWFKIMETNSLNTFGGTLPAVDSIENAIVIHSFSKSDFSTFSDFRFYIIEDTTYTNGTSPKYNKNYVFDSIEKDQFKDYTYSYKVSLTNFNYPYLMEFVLIETDKSFLWIMFTATNETFDKNIEKFSEFLTGIEIL